MKTLCTLSPYFNRNLGKNSTFTTYDTLPTFVEPLSFGFVLFATNWMIIQTFYGFEQRGFKKRFTILNLLLTIELGILGGIMFVNGFNPSLLALLLASGTIWIIMLVYRFFR